MKMVTNIQGAINMYNDTFNEMQDVILKLEEDKKKLEDEIAEIREKSKPKTSATQPEKIVKIKNSKSKKTSK